MNRVPATELHSLAEVDAWLDGGHSLAGAYLQSVDLRGLAPELLAAGVAGTIFLGCELDPGVEGRLVEAGALVFPRLPDLPFDPYRGGLYSPEELYAGLEAGYRHTLDARVYRWWQDIGHQPSLRADLAMTLHDHAVLDALGDLRLSGAIGVMGGHRFGRDHPIYLETARLGRELAAAGHTVLTGGGPGLMEAAALGAALAGGPEDLAAAVAILAGHPSFAPDVTAWAGAGFAVRRRWQLTGPSIGIPTWLYGHEPPNVFGRQVAKFFSNALREDALLRLADAGVIYLPGAAGTVQEIFQAVTPRYYADGEDVPPLVFVDSEHWTRTLPAWPLVSALAQGRPLAGRIHLCDTVAEAARFLANDA